MGFGELLTAFAGLVVLAVIAGAVQQIMEGELFAGIGILAVGFVLLGTFAGGAALFDFDAMPVELSDLPGVSEIPGISEFLGEEPTSTPGPVV